jgi:hypothetical protein
MSKDAPKRTPIKEQRRYGVAKYILDFLPPSK